MKLTCCLNDFSLHLPEHLEDVLFPIFTTSLKDDTIRSESFVSAFLDLVVAFQECNVAHSLNGKHAVLKADLFKVIL